MTTYKISIWESTGFIKEEETTDYSKVVSLKKNALERARKCLPWGDYPENFRHLVYYYELPSSTRNNVVKVTIRENPQLVDDEVFYNFVDYWKPLYVGAIHRL